MTADVVTEVHHHHTSFSIVFLEYIWWHGYLVGSCEGSAEKTLPPQNIWSMEMRSRLSEPAIGSQILGNGVCANEIFDRLCPTPGRVTMASMDHSRDMRHSLLLCGRAFQAHEWEQGHCRQSWKPDVWHSYAHSDMETAGYKYVLSSPEFDHPKIYVYRFQRAFLHLIREIENESQWSCINAFLNCSPIMYYYQSSNKSVVCIGLNIWSNIKNLSSGNIKRVLIIGSSWHHVHEAVLQWQKIAIFDQPHATTRGSSTSFVLPQAFPMSKGGREVCMQSREITEISTRIV